MATSEPAVIRALREFKAGLLLQEELQMRQMAQRWLQVEAALQDKIDLLAQDLIDYGGHISRSKLYQLEHFKALLAQTRRELRRYADYADNLVTNQQYEWGALGLEHAGQATQLSLFGAGEITASFNRLSVTAIENMVGLAGNGQPLGRLLQQRVSIGTDKAPGGVEGLVRSLVNSTALGVNPRQTAQLMKDGLAGGLNNALVIARTEQNRVYRMAATQQYRESGVVSGFRRLAAHDLRTCLGCLALEGERFTLADELSDHPSGRCAAIPTIIGAPELRFVTGAEWFRSMDASAQREMMGEQMYHAWRGHQFKFSDLGRHTHDSTWGGGVRVATLNELVGKAA